MRKILAAILMALIGVVCALAQAPTPGVLVANPLSNSTVRFCGFGPVGGVPILCSSGLPGGALSSALAFAKTVPVNLTVIGDEFAICDQNTCGSGPASSTNRWVERLRISLQGQYGSAGTGLVPLLSRAVDVSTATGVNGDAWVCTGPLTNTTTSIGPGQNGLSALVAIPAGSSCTFSDSRDISWDTGVVFCSPSPTAGTSLSVAIDGGTAQQVCLSTGSPQAEVVKMSKVASNGTHAVVFSGNGALLYGFQGLDTTHPGGVSVSNLGISGAQAGMYGSAPATQLAFSDANPNGQAVFVYEGEINDPIAGTSTTTFQAELQAIVAHEQSIAGHPQVAIAIPPADVVSTAYDLSPFMTVQVAVCSSNNLQCPNLSAMWGAYSPTTGLWDGSGDTGATWVPGNTFGTVPNDAGNYAEYQVISPALTNEL